MIFAAWLILLLVNFYATYKAIKKLQEKKKIQLRVPFHVAVLKPIKGFDPGLRENLKSFFLLTYPRYSLHFCFESELEPAVQMVRDLILIYREVNAEIHIENQKFTHKIANPKIRNLMCAYMSLNHVEHFIISDAGARVEPDYIQTMVSPLDPDVGVTTSMVACEYPQSLAGEVESVALNTFYTRLRVLGFAVGRPTVMGLSLLFKRRVVDAFGGLAALGDYLAEDFMMGQKVVQLGFKVALIPTPVRQYLGKYTFQTYLNRHIRWTRLRFVHSPFEFLLEPLLYSVVSGVLMGLVNWRYLPIHFGLYLASDLTLMSHLDKGSRSTPLAWIIREVTTPLMWLYALSGFSVNWRGNKLKLRFGGRIERE